MIDPTDRIEAFAENEELKKNVFNLIYSGRKIEAIKIYREATGSGLKEAKETVEMLEADLRRQFPERFAAQKGNAGCLSAVLFLFAVVAMAT